MVFASVNNQSESQNSDASVYLKLWYCPYICVEYHRLHENNLAQKKTTYVDRGEEMVSTKQERMAICPFTLLARDTRKANMATRHYIVDGLN
jgi:hypothetical protein